VKIANELMLLRTYTGLAMAAGARTSSKVGNETVALNAVALAATTVRALIAYELQHYPIVAATHSHHTGRSKLR
jgi:hypothetical protein